MPLVKLFARLLKSNPLSCRFLVVCLLIVAPCFPQTVNFQTLNRQIIEARLREAPNRNNDRKKVLEEMFLAVGCRADHLIEQPIDGKKLPNLICVLQGESDSTIVVGGHYDMAELGLGVVDNWSGASLLPSIYESLSSEKRHHTFVFLGLYAEEQGLIGSEFYVRQLTKEQRAKIRAMVNLDCLGLSSTKVAVDQSDRKLLYILEKIAQRSNLPLAGVNVSKVGMDDSISFKRHKIPTISIHSVTQDSLTILHSLRDNLDAINWDDYYNTYRLMTAFLAGLDVLAD
jgi:hypothetical protein